MMSSFWNGYVLNNFIFEGFGSKTVPGFIGVFVAILSLGILFEGLHLLKKRLLEKYFRLRRQIRINNNNESIQPQFPHMDGNNSNSGDEDTTTDIIEDLNIHPRNSLINDERFENLESPTSRISHLSKFLMLTEGHETIYLFLASALHTLYVFIGYTLMNAVMTFNTWIFVAICLGVGIGYFVFCGEENGGKQGDANQGRKFSIEAYAQLQDETDKTDDFADNVDRTSPTGTSSSRRSRDESPVGSERKGRLSHSKLKPKRFQHQQEPLDSSSIIETSAAAQVLVVGAQVHCNQQSV